MPENTGLIDNKSYNSKVNNKEWCILKPIKNPR